MKINAVIFLTISLAFTSCVSSKKYNLLLSENTRMSNRIDRLEIDRERGEKAASDLEKCNENLLATQTLLNNLNSRYNGLQESFSQLEKQYEEVVLQNNELLEVTSKEKKELNEEINRKEAELEQQAEVLAARQASIQQSEDRINELTDLLNREKLKMDSLQSNISKALFVFGPSDLSITQKDGKVYVSLSQKLLFDKGSDQLDVQGENALTKLADVLIQRNDIDIMVEGHTDSDGTPARNWDLSTRRATAVVKLLQEAGVDPASLTAAGRAFYDPIAENNSEDNKSINRRTEIILSPKLDVVLDLIRTE